MSMSVGLRVRSIQALGVLRVCLLAFLICDGSLVVFCVYTCAPSAQLSWVEPTLVSPAYLSHLDPYSPSQTIDFDESSGAVLRIQPLRTPRDENVYECVAQNSVGEITVHAKLTVLRGTRPGHRGSARLQSLLPSWEPSFVGSCFSFNN